ncbi:MAG: ferrous iron transport protein B [Candidatus Eisenbacteria bacterium]|uniref:Ferrous iron transport protein B n=1 Tax=Eiseniibacteriota bacterium TaxID=2212470 RepID=A0A849SJX3_UNCEI|nr:ferrous iron transport protein B [Candidatus Eisenbacteria bacterium]
MSRVTELQTALRTVAILGNPNAGKSTLFNQLTGLRQKVGNYPGVTVEKKTGRCELPSGRSVQILDLPGSYSLQPNSPDEMIVRDVLLGLQDDTPPPDLIIFVVDVTNLGRHLYLALQVIELGRPLVLALNMMDAARAQGLLIDEAALERELGVPVVGIAAARGEGLGSLRRLMDREVEPSARRFRQWPPHLERVLQRLASRLPRHPELPERARHDLALALLLDDGEDDALARHAPADVLDDARTLARRLDIQSPAWRSDEVEGRYEAIHEIVQRATVQQGAIRDRTRERVDRVLTHRIFGPVIFVLLMGAAFQSVFAWAQPGMDLIDALVGRFSLLVSSLLPAGPLRSLLVDGVIAGVGTTLTFIPQIAILFLFISVLEDSGYMARAAFIMDRLMGRVGLSGRAFIPMLSSFACAIPGVMATRTIDNRRDRLATIMVAPFMSCSARLPVYALLIGAFIPHRWVGPVTLAGLTLFSMYLLGVLAAIVVAAILKRTVLRGGNPLYVMELPPYRMPSWRSVLATVRERCVLFVRKAGSVILAVSVVLWFLASYPRGGPEISSLSAQISAAETAGDVAGARALERRMAGVALENSFAGRVGRFLEPAIAPLGFDWRIGIGLVTSFAAREVMVSTMATVFQLGDADESSESLRDQIRNASDARTGRPAYSPLMGVSLMVFFVLACQCMSTVAVVKRETNSWRWPIFMLVMMNALAWLASFAVYQGGRLLGFPA